MATTNAVTTTTTLVPKTIKTPRTGAQLLNLAFAHLDAGVQSRMRPWITDPHNRPILVKEATRWVKGGRTSHIEFGTSLVCLFIGL
jgi:hypothetical protein